MEATSALHLVRLALEDYPSVELEQFEGGLSIKASEGGFDAIILEKDGQQSVSGGLWHEHFGDSRVAADCFLWLLTPAVRIVEKRRKGVPVSARLERNEAGKWINCGTTTLLLQPFFLRSEEVVLQNAHIVRNAEPS